MQDAEICLTRSPLLLPCSPCTRPTPASGHFTAPLCVSPPEPTLVIVLNFLGQYPANRATPFPSSWILGLCFSPVLILS